MRSKNRQLKLLFLLMTLAFSTFIILWVFIFRITEGSNEDGSNSRRGPFSFIISSSEFSVGYDFLLPSNSSSSGSRMEETLLEAEVEEEADALEQLLAMATNPIRVEDLITQSQNSRKDFISSNKADLPGGGGHDHKNCQMENCFNFKKCQNDLKVYVYPPDKFVPISTTYEKILNRVMSSPYYTNEPEEACLFILSIDTLDRDSLSHDFVRNLGSRLSNLEYWNNGENHLIWNLYAGTWPDYNETELGFDYGKAILVKASMSLDQFRPNFDVSLPLFHPSHPEKGDELGTAVTNEFPARKKHLVAFKGKRYVYGIGSETRNSIYHLHNGADIIMVTTCKHGKNWKEMKDERCDEDNREYEKYDYETLLQNSTFCLVPRGRRLGSFRFLEALKAGCIPVLLSNGWVLPFSEVLDWTAAAVIADERTLLQTLEVIRSVDKRQIFRMKQQTQILWNQYLSSVEKIVETVFETMKDRIRRSIKRDSFIWNSSPGALSIDTSFGETLHEFPFYHVGNVTSLKPNFTAIIRVQQPMGTVKSSSYTSSTLFKVIKNLGKSQFVSKIIIVWSSNKPVPRVWPDIRHPIVLKQTTSYSPTQRFFTDDIDTDAVFILDEDTVLMADEFEFAYRTWRSFPDRIVGYHSRSHYWNEYKEQWMFSSKASNEYSLALNGGFILHVYYNHLYWLKLPPAALMIIESFQNCDDIAMNLLVARVTKKPPIKLTANKKPSKDSLTRSSQWLQQERMQQRHNCLNELYDIYGSMPLLRSSVRFDPILFRDPVSNLRKKYRQLEL